MRTRTTTNPAFYGEQLRLLLSDEPERLERALTAPCSVDLLTWNVFAALDTHLDRDWLAHRLQALGGAAVRAPLRISLWTGRVREPLVTPSRGAVAHLRERLRAAGADETHVQELVGPLDVPVRIETPEVLTLVDTTVGGGVRGRGGRDRIVDLIDAGLDQARRLSAQLAVAVVYASGTPGADELSARVAELRSPAALAAALPWREHVPPVVLREMSWQQLLRILDAERDYLDLDGQPLRQFDAWAAACGLR